MADPHSLLNREKFPVLREFPLPGRLLQTQAAPCFACFRAAIRCISEAELRNFNRLVLIFCMPRAHARARPHRTAPIFRLAGASAPLTAGAEASLDPAHSGKGRMT